MDLVVGVEFFVHEADRLCFLRVSALCAATGTGIPSWTVPLPGLLTSPFFLFLLFLRRVVENLILERSQVAEIGDTRKVGDSL
jgi:hypothetical protein